MKKNNNVIEGVVFVNSLPMPARVCITKDHVIVQLMDSTKSIKLIHNSNYAFKLNKTSVSTCSAAVLADTLTFKAYFDRLVKSVYGLQDNNDTAAATISNFFSQMSIDHFTEYLKDISRYKTSVTHERYKTILNYLFCDDHTGKMQGMISCSTFVKYNAFCLARRNNCPGCICDHCFAYDQTSAYITQAEKLKKAHVFLTTIELSEKDIPDIDINKYPFFRFESFGDIANVLQFKNYCTIAGKLDQLCTLWTKNPGIVQAAINDGVIIPDNLRIGLSSLYVNKPEIEKAKRYPFIRFVFTVYDHEYAAAHNIDINCGARHCLSCMNCYGEHLNNYGNGNVLVINELLK